MKLCCELESRKNGNFLKHFFMNFKVLPPRKLIGKKGLQGASALQAQVNILQLIKVEGKWN